MNQIKSIEYIENSKSRINFQNKSSVDFLSKSEVSKIRDFHRIFPDYDITPVYRATSKSYEYLTKSIFFQS